MIDTKENEERGRMICQTLAFVVESLVEPSEFATAPYQQPSKFEAFRAPGISIRDYLMRIHKYASCSPECFVLALVYIDRLQRMQGFVLTELNVHRVVITSVVLAAKFFDDHYFNNAYYAKVGGVLCKEMNELEIEYLLLINFSLHVPTDTYARFYNDLSHHYTFTSAVRSPYMQQPSPYYQLRHYVADDPENDGQLMYFTDYIPRVPETLQPPPMRTSGYHHSRSHPQYQQHQQVGAQAQAQAQAPVQLLQQQHPLFQQQAGYYQQPQPQPSQQPPPRHRHHAHHQPHHQHRTIEEPRGAYAVAAATSVGAPSASSSSSVPLKAPTSSSPTPLSSTSTVRITTTTARASGQKRRSAVALGVNA